MHSKYKTIVTYVKSPTFGFCKTPEDDYAEEHGSDKILGPIIINCQESVEEDTKSDEKDNDGTSSGGDDNDINAQLAVSLH
jgi:hypothetical protein